MPDIPTNVEARVRARFEPCLDDDEILLAVHEPVYDEPDGCVAVTRHQLCWNSRIEGPTRLAWSSFSPSAVIVTSEALRVNNEEIHNPRRTPAARWQSSCRHLAALAMIPP